ncbi:MAG TPA: DUF4189 domain-containing protein [Xanthobacteraceae bacterium]|jgi:hypothetical protein
MILLRRACAVVAILCFFATAIGAAHAAGSLAVGACGAFGYGYDYRKLTDARTAAMKKCVGNACKIVGDIKRGCAALAVDAKHPCGSFGWAINPHLGKAENASLKRCYQFGGRDCVVRAFACDEKG